MIFLNTNKITIHTHVISQIVYFRQTLRVENERSTYTQVYTVYLFRKVPYFLLLCKYVDIYLSYFKIVIYFLLNLDIVTSKYVTYCNFGQEYKHISMSGTIFLSFSLFFIN